VLIDCFPRLKALYVGVTCGAYEYWRWRKERAIDDPFGSLYGQSATFKARYPDLIIFTDLTIICEYATPFNGVRPVDPDTLEGRELEQSWSLPRQIYFKATPATSPYAWEGLELEQIRTI